MNCKRCNQPLPTDGNVIPCSICKEAYHIGCSGLSESTFRSLSSSRKQQWKCIECRDGMASQKTKVTQASHEGENIKRMFDVINKKLDSQKKDMEKLINDITGLGNLYDGLKQEVTALKKANQELSSNVTKLLEENRLKDKKIGELEIKINMMEQRSRNVNMEIHGMEKIEKEDEEQLKEAVFKMVKCLEVPVEKEAIQVAHRLPKPRGKIDAIPAVIVRFSSQTVRDKILSSKRKVEVNNNMILQNNSERKLFITENLTSYNKNLLWQAKSRARDKGWRFVWVKYGKILVKKSNEMSSVIRIEHESDLVKIN